MWKSSRGCGVNVLELAIIQRQMPVLAEGICSRKDSRHEESVEEEGRNRGRGRGRKYDTRRRVFKLESASWHMALLSLSFLIWSRPVALAPSPNLYKTGSQPYLYLLYSPSGFAHLRFSLFPVFAHLISCHDTGSRVPPVHKFF